jgi:Hemerythrin HHE cation binding domain
MDERNKGVTEPDRLSESAGAPATLAAEHEQLLSEVSDRAGVVLRETAEGHWPSLAVRELVDYLHLEVLQQVVDEEWLLFGSAYHAPEELARLRRDHLELRLAIDTLAQVAADRGDLRPRQLAAATQDLLARLGEHLAAEERVLSTARSNTPSTTELGAQPHEWYAITEQSVIDLDRLPGRRASMPYSIDC